MNYIIIIVVVGLVAILVAIILSKKFAKNNPFLIDLSKKQVLQGNLEDHEAGVLVSLIAKVTKNDSSLSELESQIINNTLTDIANTFTNPEIIRERLKDIYNKEKRSFENTIFLSKKYSVLVDEYKKRIAFVEYLLNLSLLDGYFSENERMITEDIAEVLNLRENDYEKLLNKYILYYKNQKDEKTYSLAQAYEVLGVYNKASFKEIEKRYRKLIIEYHPDILQVAQKEDDYISNLTKKLQKINQAFIVIKNKENS